MKKLLITLYLFIPLIAAANVTDTVITINHLPENAYLLNKGWKFKSGDNMAYAKSDYNDRSWESINPNLYIPQLPAAAQDGIGWMRIKLSISPNLIYEAAIMILQSPAVEIYLNGSLVGKRGTINNHLKTGIGYTNQFEPVELRLTNAPVQVLAIRYAYQPGFNYINRYLLPNFARIFFVNTPQLNYYTNRVKYLDFEILIATGILLLLSFFHFTLWRYNKMNKSNLFFAGYAFLFSLFLINAFLINEKSSLNINVGVYIASDFLYLVSALLGIKALCELYKFRTGFYYRLLIVVAVSGLLIPLFCESLNNLIYVDLILVTLIELAITIKAIVSKRRGALIVATGFSISLIGWFSYIYLTTIYLSTHITTPTIPFLIAILMSMLGPALSISIFLAREFALDARLLAIKLIEVEELSAVNLAQEREKQQLLANQNQLLEQQVKVRTSELNQSLTNLKQTQTQLIQSEKMASLGELTAGIAHEIQNPLNFVNNFSDVNCEMIDELKEELKNGNTNEAIAIADDIQQNEEKINHHGKRADFIVKGMLQHSRTSTGERQLTNINILADEFLKLSYHGLRAKDKFFNAELTTNFDENLPKISVVPQDIGRVLLNLFNNAFYAIQQKQKTAGAEYKPEVTVDTSFTDTFLVIKVKDNGIGIPDSVKDKVMQPFFTTKPTGEGTGLGLSLSYDIVVKGHGGKIDVESNEGKGSEFLIQLSRNQ